MWYKNSREMAINRHMNDALTVRGPEGVYMDNDGVRRSLFADGSGETKVTYGFGLAIWEKKTEKFSTKMTAFVPPDTAARVLINSMGIRATIGSRAVQATIRSPAAKAKICSFTLAEKMSLPITQLAKTLYH